MHLLTERKKAILYHIINTYIESMQPIGSKSLTSKKDLGFSSATIRNEMGDLEDMGFITHPHTSAGRVPTDLGYRYYVDHLIDENMLTESEMNYIESVFHEQIESMDDLIEKTSHIVATLSKEACISILYEPAAITLQQVNLVMLDPRRLVVTWVTTAGHVAHDVVEMPHDMDESMVHAITTFLNTEVRGMALNHIGTYIIEKLERERASLYHVYEQACLIVKRSLSHYVRAVKVSLEGRRYMLDKPEFHDLDKTKKIMDLLEDKKELLNLLRCTEERGLSIRIGKENQREDLWDCALVGAHYELYNQPIGMITILGPKRLQYGRIVSLLRHMSSLMTETISNFEHR